MMEFAVKLRCEECGTEIRFENETPKWKVDEDRRQDIMRAAEFMAKYKDARVGDIPERRPSFVHLNLLTGRLVFEPQETRYIDCPVCESEVYIGSGK